MKSRTLSQEKARAAIGQVYILVRWSPSFVEVQHYHALIRQGVKLAEVMEVKSSIVRPQKIPEMQQLCQQTYEM